MDAAIVAFVLLFSGSHVNEIKVTIEIRQASQEIEKPSSNPARKVWRQVRKPIQLGGGIDDGYELVEEQ